MGFWQPINTDNIALNNLKAVIGKPTSISNYTGGAPWLDPAQRSYVGGSSAQGQEQGQQGGNVIPPTNRPIPPWQLKLLQDANKPGGVDNPNSPVDEGPSAYEQYQQMVAQFNPSKMASDQYGPQYAMLDRLNADAQKRYGANNRSMGDMYGALQASIRGDAAGISSNYDTAGNTLDQNYADTQKEVSGYQDASRAKTAELMQNLGIQAAAPTGIGRMNDSGDRWNKLMATTNLSNTNANTQRKTSALNYNNTMQERAGFEGAAQKTGLLNGLNDFLNQNAGKRLGIQGEQSGTESGYKMKLMDMYGQMASRQGTNEASAIKAANAQANSDRTFKASQDAAKLAQDKNSQSQMTPYDKLIQSANGMNFESSGTAPTTVSDLIKAQYIGDDNGKFLDSGQSQSLNGNEFIKQLMTENPAILARPGFSQASFENLARQYFDNMYKK